MMDGDEYLPLMEMTKVVAYDDESAGIFSKPGAFVACVFASGRLVPRSYCTTAAALVERRLSEDRRTQLGRRIRLDVRKEMRVHLQCHARVAVPEQVRDLGDRRAVRDQHRGVTVPERMPADLPKPGLP